MTVFISLLSEMLLKSITTFTIHRRLQHYNRQEVTVMPKICIPSPHDHSIMTLAM